MQNPFVVVIPAMEGWGGEKGRAKADIRGGIKVIRKRKGKQRGKD